MERIPNDQLRKPEISGTLLRVCGEPQEITTPFRLLSMQNQEQIGEFYSQKLESHLIIFDESGNIAKSHDLLSERTNYVFPDIRVGEQILLVVPEGARTLSSIAPLVSRNIQEYSIIFKQLGRTLRTLDDAHVGLPNKDILGSFAFAADPDSPTGAKVFFVPPYERHIDTGLDEIVDTVFQELTGEHVLAEQAAELIISNVKGGWNEIG